MPWARFETELIRHEKIQAIPPSERPCSIALYFAAVSYCAEMLTDGHISRAVMAGLTEEIAARKPRKVIDELVRVGLLDRTTRGYCVHDYLEYQSSRQEVLDKRAYEAEKKRRARGQRKLPLDNVPPDVPKGQTGGQGRNVPPGQGGGLARATRGGAEAHAPSSSPRDAAADQPRPGEPTADPAAAQDLEDALDELGFDIGQLAKAMTEPARAQAWLHKARLEAETNPGGYVWKGITGGQWPVIPNGAQPTKARSTEDWVRDAGWMFQPDDLLDELEHRCTDQDERHRLQDLAADLRRDAAA